MRHGSRVVVLDVRTTALSVGVHLSDETVKALERELHERYDSAGGFVSDLRIWVKSRLSELGILRARRMGTDDITLFTIMHCFPIYRAAIVLPDDGQGFTPRVARSKIFTGQRLPRPIDGNAFNVAPGSPPPTLDELVKFDE